MPFRVNYKDRARAVTRIDWVMIVLAGVLSAWPARVVANIGTANSPPFSLNTMALPAATHLTVNVEDSRSLLPIGNATVVLAIGSNHVAATTDQYGTCHFRNVDYQADPVALVVERQGYRSLSTSTPLTEGGTISIKLQMQSRTVLLLHGFASDPGVWSQPLYEDDGYTFESYLEADTSPDSDNSFNVITIPFRLNCASLAVNAKVLSEYLDLVNMAGIKSYSIVAHSMGGLIARRCLASSPWSVQQVHYLVMLATPNHGSGLAGARRVLRGEFIRDVVGFISGCSGAATVIDDFIPGSPALDALNYGVEDVEAEDDACHYHGKEHLYGLDESKVYQIAGTAPLFPPCSIFYPYVCGALDRTATDGVVATYSARLQSTPRDNFWLDSELGTSVQHFMGEHAITRSAVVAQTVKNILNDILPIHGANSVEAGRSEEAGLVQSQPELAGLVSSATAFVDSLQLNATSTASFLAVWQADSLAFNLRTPSGDLITPAYADTSLRVDFAASARTAQYRLTQPEAGWWHVLLSSAAAAPESLWVLTSFDSPLTLEAEVSSVVAPYEDCRCSALFLESGGPLPNATVGAKVTDPNGAITSMQLFDDGTHGDQVPFDGQFFNVYSTNDLTGAYRFEFTATRDTTEVQSEQRVANDVAFVNATAEISIDPTGLVVSNPRPTLGSVVSMTSTFQNVGVADADTVRISLRNVSLGTVLADTTVSMAVGQALSFQAAWLAVVPDTTRFQVTATLGGGAYEANYSNNSAATYVRVCLIEGVSSVVDPESGGDGAEPGLPAVLEEQLGLVIGPNPFNPSVEISFLVPQDNCPVAIDIFDVSGRLIRRLVCEVMSRGHHEIQWDGTDDLGKQSASGLYFCRLDAGGRVAVRKMMTIR